MALGWRRIVAAGLLTVMVAALFATPSHAQGPSGVGSAGGSTTLAALDAGDLLKLALIGEQNSATIDPANGTPTANEAVTPLTVVSQTLPALNALTTPAVSTNSTGAPDTKQTAQIDLGSVPQPAPLLSGTVNAASLSSLVDSSGAHSTMNATLANVAVAAGIAKIDSASVDIGSIASSTQSTASRTVAVNGVTVLDLRALLQMVGLDLNKLPLQTLADLIQQLGLLDTLNAATGQNFGSAADIVSALTTPAITSAQNAVNTAQAAVNTAQATFDSAQAALDSAQTTLDGANAQVASATTALNDATAAATGLLCNVTPALPLCQAVAAAQAALNTAISAQGVAQTAFNTAQTAFNTAKTALDAAVAALNTALAALNGVLGQLQGVIDGLANTLELQPLLRVEGIQVGASSLAADTVGNSSAVTTATIGNIKVGGINLGGVDAGATVDQITALAGQATQAVDNVLSAISPQLANLVHVELFKHSTDVSQSGDYVNALAGITGLLATITPPDVCALLNDVLTQLPVGLNSLPGVTLPALPISGVLSTIGSTINCSVPGILQAQATIPALTTPITLAAAQANSAAAFAPSQQSTTTTTTTTTTPANPSTSTPSSSGTPTSTNTSAPLARTGAENALFLFAGALLLMVAYATRRTMVAVKSQNHSQ
ncbi:MAG TPA: hypothetical protein VFV00_10870 [Acidimicrobiales bacterium]|nr:hypothetical protein [Acidimicrobiales bacterium]